MKLLFYPPFDFERDFLLPLPASDWSGVIKSAAIHSDALAIYRSLFERLRVPTYVKKSGIVTWIESPKLLVPSGWADAWTTHSCRKNLPTLAGALGNIAPWEIDLLGRWEAGGSAAYIQSRADSVRRVQDAVCSSLRSAARWYGEDELMDDISKLMRNRGTSEETVATVIARFRFKLPGHPFAEGASGSSISRGGSNTQVSTGDLDIKTAVKDLAEGLDASAGHDDGSGMPFWISISRRTGFRRLHRAGGCWYTSAQVERYSTLSGVLFHARCGRCWPDEEKESAVPDEVIVTDVSVDTEGESSSSDVP